MATSFLTFLGHFCVLLINKINHIL